MKAKLALLASLIAITGFSAQQGKIVVKDTPIYQVSPVLWGIFFEDINLSADGGIYPEQVRNRSFEDSDKPEHWIFTEVDGASGRIAIDTTRPINPFNRRSLRLSIDSAGSGSVSLINRGYWGINAVKDEEYIFSMFARCGDGFSGTLDVEIVGENGRAIAKGEVKGIGNNWRKFSLSLTPEANDRKASLVIRAKSRGTVWIDMVSLMPKNTYKGHGLRIDICKMLEDLKPSFVRFPGGCWVEGDDMAHMYNWKKTIGNIEHRVPLWNIWGYWATHGLGYLEYLQLSEDLGAEPMLCINVGMSHREVVPMDQMGQWVQDALDAIEYANGSTNSVWGLMRAIHGREKPFKMKYVEIGNENGGPAYRERWAIFYRAIKAKYPDIQLIANVWGGYPTDPMPDIIDEHYYDSPEFFIRQANKYDTYSRKGPKVFVGEYAVTRGCGNGNLRGAIGEAAFMTGIERNSDIVVMAAYAPLFANVNHKRWNPDLIYFDNHRVYGTPSYYVQKMFSENRGDYVLPVDVESPEIASRPAGGTIGVGTWNTRAEFKDIRVISDGKTVFESDFSKGTQGWRFLGGGDWTVVDGALRQNRIAENIRAIVPGLNFTEYTLMLKARKLGGAEGFLILFNVSDPGEKSWWNIGGWGNREHAIEMGGIIGNRVNGQVEENKWYDIKIEVNRERIKCYLDGKLIHDNSYPVMKAIYASATVTKSDEVIVKVVNVAYDSQEVEVVLPKQAQGKKEAIVTVLTSANATDENSFEEPMKVSPKTSGVKLNGNSLKYVFPPNSLTVFRVK